MDYEQFFPKQECDCSNHIRGTIIVLTVLSILIDSVAYCRRDKKITELTSENQTLKTIILKSVDRALVKMMKNGHDSENDE
jgi:hypothetical protein